MANTTIYFIRHSIRFSSQEIETYHTTQSEILRSEKSILSVEGEKRAERLASLPELQNIDKVYASNCVRTLQTAKYLLKAQQLKVNIDERLDERRFGKRNDVEYPNWYSMQFLDENFKTEGGESQKEVRARMEEVFMEIVNANRGKRIAIFSHGYAIAFLLMKWAKLENVTEERKLTFSYQGKIIFDQVVDAPDIFRMVLDENNQVIEIAHVERAND